MKKIFAAALLLLTLAVTSCTTFKASGLTVLKPSENVKVLGHFERKVTVHEFLGNSGGANLFNVTADAMEERVTELVWQEIGKLNGNGAINVEIEYSATFVDALLNGITSGIYAPAHLYIAGDVVQFGSIALGEESTDESISLALADL